jgi:hypothetical protein
MNFLQRLWRSSHRRALADIPRLRQACERVALFASLLGLDVRAQHGVYAGLVAGTLRAEPRQHVLVNGQAGAGRMRWREFLQSCKVNDHFPPLQDLPSATSARCVRALARFIQDPGSAAPVAGAGVLTGESKRTRASRESSRTRARDCDRTRLSAEFTNEPTRVWKGPCAMVRRWNPSEPKRREMRRFWSKTSGLTR